MVIKLKNIEVPNKLSDISYQAIKESILTADPDDLADGGRIDEKKLTEQLGISRTPIREAINRLVVEGFLKILPRQGIYVATKSKEEIIEILLVRSVLEGMAARLATIHTTKEEIVKMKGIFTPFLEGDLQNCIQEYSEANIRFHEIVLELSRCKKLLELASNLFDQMRMIRIQTAGYKDRTNISISQHMEIIDAIEKKDSELAENLMRKHVEEVIKVVEEQLNSPEESQK